MGFYARPSRRLFWQVAADLFMLAWGAAWWFVGRFVDGSIRALAEPARQTARLTGDLRSQVADAAERASGVPVVGGGLRQPFDGMTGNLQQIADAAREQVAGIEQAALVLGWLLFLLPVALMVAVWLPPRLEFASRSRAMVELAARPEGTDLLALRALATQPLGRLAAISPDAASAWRSRDPEVVRRLADLELASAGLRRRRPTTLNR